VRHPAVVSGKIDTGYLDRHLDEFLRKPSAANDERALFAAATAWLLHEERAGAEAARRSGDPYSPWAEVDGWRPAHLGKRIVALADRGERREIVAYGARGRYGMRLDETGRAVDHAVLTEGVLSATIDGETRRWRAGIDGDRVAVHDGTERRVFHHAPAFEYVATVAGTGDRIVAPMPGRIVLVKAKAGDDVAEGDEVLVMEAMKMELTLRAPRAGRIDSVQAAAGDFVEADAVLVKLAAA
jgi:3-methylcrotonyl-CoA carboxylase alpha subunit